MDAIETRVVLEGLAAKLATLELTDEEGAALARIVERAAEADTEVEGFGLLTDDGTLVLLRDPKGVYVGWGHGDAGPKLAQGLGLDPSRVWTGMRPLS